MIGHAARTTCRLFDFLHRRTPWPRRLWGIGTVLGLLKWSSTARYAGREGSERTASMARSRWQDNLANSSLNLSSGMLRGIRRTSRGRKSPDGWFS